MKYSDLFTDFKDFIAFLQHTEKYVHGDDHVALWEKQIPKSLYKNTSNKNIINILMYYKKKSSDNKFKVIAYTKAIDIIKSLTFELTPYNVLFLIKKKLIGKSIFNKIVEILLSGTFKNRDIPVMSPEKVNEIQKILGFGPAVIKKLEALGITTYHDIKNSDYKLTTLQKLGIKYFEDLLQKIPREDVTSISSIIGSTFPKKTKWVVAGSYRRGLSSSGDIDILIQDDSDSLNFYVQKIQNIDGYIDKIGKGQTKFSFLFNFKGIARQVDIRMIKDDEWITALLYFTGSKNFNKRMRAHAKNRGFKLSEYGLFRDDKKIHIHTENDIFDIIDFPYIPPEERYY